MRIACYQGKSPISRIIRFITRSDFSHACFVFDEQSTKAAVELVKNGYSLSKLSFIQAGSVVEAWASGLRNVESISSQHTPGTVVDVFPLRVPLTLHQEMALIQLIHGDIGDGYDFWNVLKFITRRPGSENDEWFCSEQVFQRLLDVSVALFSRTLAWEVSPGLIPRSREFGEPERVVTI